MQEELTKEMHSEFSISKEDENKLRAGCVWHVWCGRNSTRKEIEDAAKQYSISYETAKNYRDYWLRMYRK